MLPPLSPNHLHVSTRLKTHKEDESKLTEQLEPLRNVAKQPPPALKERPEHKEPYAVHKRRISGSTRHPIAGAHPQERRQKRKAHELCHEVSVREPAPAVSGLNAIVWDVVVPTVHGSKLEYRGVNSVGSAQLGSLGWGWELTGRSWKTRLDERWGTKVNVSQTRRVRLNWQCTSQVESLND